MRRIPDDVRAITEATRTWAEKKATFRYRSDLNGMCAIASAELWRRLKRAGHDVKLAQSRTKSQLAHVFVVYRNRYILDITATQFGHDRVEVRWFHNLLHPWYWKAATLYPNDEELHLDQVRLDWPSHQLANGHPFLD